MKNTFSIIIPAKNEAGNLRKLLPELIAEWSNAEIIIVNDGSDDDTTLLDREFDIRIINQPYNIGNGAAVKTGARNAKGDILVFMDADGQHQVKDIKRLTDHLLDNNYDMVVGARISSSHAGMGRRIANNFYNTIASWMVNNKVEDLTSGFRAVRADKFREFAYLLPNGFSYPTTITMAFFRAGYAIAYLPIEALKRGGKSHIRPIRDGLRFLLIIFRVGTLYSPLKLFLPISLFHLAIGITYYAYTYISHGRFTNMSALLIITAILIFLIGLVSEQISNLLYAHKDK